MHWVIVTGAGASRELGQDKQLPLMGDWAAALCSELDAREPGLAAGVGLSTSMASTAFEETIGALLRWQEMRPLNERFQALGGAPINHVYQPVVEARGHEQQRLTVIMDAINTTLFRLFGTSSIDRGKAVGAWDDLLGRLGDTTRLTVVTTNYDPSAEIALAGLGRTPDTGFERLPGHAPMLSPAGLVDRARGDGAIVPVLHLHGAVGWYEHDGAVLEHHQNLAFNDTLGRPVVLYPDPDKDPTRDAVVHALWQEFDDSLSDATGVLVLGHSLHDPALVAKLQEASEHAAVGITTYGRDGEPAAGEPEVMPDDRETQRLLALSSSNTNIFNMRFGPGPRAWTHELDSWLEALAARSAGAEGRA
jgi:hypothetical protein